MKPTERTGGRRVELFVRDSLPKPAARQRERLTDQLAELKRDGALASYAEFTWDKRIQQGDPVKTRARERYNEFATWAREHDASLRPFFGTRECYSMKTGEFGEWIVFPALCLAVYEDGDLVSVFPHADGEHYRSVQDGLDAFARRSAESTDEPEANADDDATRDSETDDEAVVLGSAD